ncbi:hypothetical protein MLD38_030491 [Melastoma candidum]|uniref:Uncharacterized protein n=1 Tax=Melastoma candidum TaxID=119954 RepID=A0ACB9MLC4_9MYRT|nr:hypothetical protein MLD38_030491 [Melastoma candidum]
MVGRRPWLRIRTRLVAPLPPRDLPASPSSPTSPWELSRQIISAGTADFLAYHKCRAYWNVDHYAIGYFVIVLSVVHVFKGLDVLNPDGKWKKAYVSIPRIPRRLCHHLGSVHVVHYLEEEENRGATLRIR